MSTSVAGTGTHGRQTQSYPLFVWQSSFSRWHSVATRSRDFLKVLRFIEVKPRKAGTRRSGLVQRGINRGRLKWPLVPHPAGHTIVLYVSSERMHVPFEIQPSSPAARPPGDFESERL